MTTVAAVICVRMASSRLLGKALCVYDEANKKPNLQCIIERVLTSRHKPAIIVSTPTDAADDPIEAFVLKYRNAYNGYESLNNLHLYRGDPTNVVKQFNGALNEFAPQADYVWRVMADCPLVDVGLVDWRIDVLSRNKADVMTIIQPEPTYAAQASIWSRAAWDYCAKMSSGSMLEHPGEFIYENLGEFKTLHEPGPENVYYQDIRTELDTPEDLEFFRRIWNEYTNDTEQVSLDGRIRFRDTRISTRGALRWLSDHPEIVAINQHIEMKTKSTHLHGHHRARDWMCKSCGHVVAVKINDALAVQCQRCGEERRFYP